MLRAAHSASRRRGGQAAVEFALLAPLLFLLVIGVSDIGRGLTYGTVATGAVRVAMRTAQNAAASNIGAAVRAEAGPSIPDNPSTWGLEAAGSSEDCAAGNACGDSNGCVPTSSFWSATSPAPTACFAVTNCTVNAATSPPTCPYPASWGARPAAGSSGGVAVAVRVVLRFPPLTPFVGNLFPGGRFDIQRDSTALPLY